MHRSAELGAVVTFTASEDTLDDLMRIVLSHLLENGQLTTPTKGPALEQLGVILELRNPRARLSRSAARSRAISALGELSWYLSGSDEVDPIAYYIKAYRAYAVDGRVEGAYGPRLFGEGAEAQVTRIIDLLRRKESSRQAVIQIFDRADTMGTKLDVPCTCTMQFFVRNSQVRMIVHMRSNDAYLGLPHDIFAFTMLQEIIARSLGLEVGSYTHMVGNLHLYEAHQADARAFLKEGWQGGRQAMPSMPLGDPWASVRSFLQAEREIRLEEYRTPSVSELGIGYWGDLIRLLLAYSVGPEDVDKLTELSETLHNSYFQIYFADRRRALEARR